MFFLLMVIVVEPVQKCVAFIAENSPHQGLYLSRKAFKQGVWAVLKQAPGTVSSPEVEG